MLCLNRGDAVKLTPEQIRDALKMLPVTPNTAECWVWPRTAAVVALDAYQRVEALAASKATLWEDHMRSITAAELRRALYGEE